MKKTYIKDKKDLDLFFQEKGNKLYGKDTFEYEKNNYYNDEIDKIPFPKFPFYIISHLETNDCGGDVVYLEFCKC